MEYLIDLDVIVTSQQELRRVSTCVTFNLEYSGSEPVFTGREVFGLDDDYFDLLSADADQFVDGEDDHGTEEEVVEERRLDEASATVHYHEDEEDGVGAVHQPEAAVAVTARILGAEHRQYKVLYRQRHSSQAYQVQTVSLSQI